MMEAQHNLEASLRPQKDMTMEQGPRLPVEYMPLALLLPFRHICVLPLRAPSPQVLHFQRRFHHRMDMLQWPRSLKPETCPQNRLLLHARRQSLFKLSPVPLALHVVSHNIVIDSAELL